MNAFANRLHAIRKEKKLSQDEIGLIIGKNKSMICKYESGEHEPSIDVLTNLCEKMNLSSDWLIGISENRYGIKKTFKRDYQNIMELLDELSEEDYRVVLRFIDFLTKG